MPWDGGIKEGGSSVGDYIDAVVSILGFALKLSGNVPAYELPVPAETLLAVGAAVLLFGTMREILQETGPFEANASTAIPVLKRHGVVDREGHVAAGT